MTPTRELALQITKECKKFSKPLGLRVVCVYGGTGISEQVQFVFSTVSGPDINITVYVFFYLNVLF